MDDPTWHALPQLPPSRAWLPLAAVLLTACGFGKGTESEVPWSETDTTGTVSATDNEALSDAVSPSGDGRGQGAADDTGPTLADAATTDDVGDVGDAAPADAPDEASASGADIAATVDGAQADGEPDADDPAPGVDPATDVGSMDADAQNDDATTATDVDTDDGSSSPSDVVSDTLEDGLVCRGWTGVSQFQGGILFGLQLHCAPDGSACCFAIGTNVPCGWRACCSDGTTLWPGPFSTVDPNWACSQVLQIPAGSTKACLTDMIPWTTCTDVKPLIAQGKIPVGLCSAQSCCPLDPGCLPTDPKKIAPMPPEPTVSVSAECKPMPTKYPAQESTDSLHVYCKPDDSACCISSQPYGNEGPCGWDACCESSPLQPKGLNWSNLSCADLATLPEPYCVKGGTRRYRVCGPMQGKTALDILQMPNCEAPPKDATTCCGKVVPACEGKPVQPMPPGP
jgi:hypothetical protein